MLIMEHFLYNLRTPLSKIPNKLKVRFKRIGISQQSQIVDIIIVGAGLSGLTTALKLQNRDPTLKVRVIEATDKSGGQLRGLQPRDIGGKWFTEEQRHLQQLLTQLEIPIRQREVPPGNFKNVTDFGGGILEALIKYELKRYINELDLWVYAYKPGFKIKKTMPMNAHIRNRLFFYKSRKYMANLVLLITGVDAEHIKYEEFMSICYTWGGLINYINLFIEFPDSLWEFSGTELLDKISKNLKHVDFSYGQKIFEINHLRSHVEMRATDNHSHYANAVVLAIPWDNIQGIKFLPPLPHDISVASLQQSKVERLITYFSAEYKEDNWRRNELSGNLVCTEPFLVAYEYHSKIITGYMVHEKDEQNVRDIILGELAKRFGEEMAAPVDFQLHSHPLPNKSHLPLTKPWNRIIWSSSAVSATCNRGCLDGAVQSGVRAALNALLITRPQIVTWQDVAEIQCKDELRTRQVSLFSLWLSSWNLYNVSTYSIFMCSLALILTQTYKKIKLH